MTPFVTATDIQRRIDFGCRTQMRYHKETVAISLVQTDQTGDLENSGFSATQRRTDFTNAMCAIVIFLLSCFLCFLWIPPQWTVRDPALPWQSWLALSCLSVAHILKKKTVEIAQLWQHYRGNYTSPTLSNKRCDLGEEAFQLFNLCLIFLFAIFPTPVRINKVCTLRFIYVAIDRDVLLALCEICPFSLLHWRS